MIHSPSVQTHQLEVSHARVLLDTLGMELQKRVSVSKILGLPHFVFCFADFPC